MTDENTIVYTDLKDGSVTATSGAWILARRYPDGKIRVISHDAPRDMLAAAIANLERR